MREQTAGRLFPIALLTVAALVGACDNEDGKMAMVSSFDCTADTVARTDSAAPKLIAISCQIGVGSAEGSGTAAEPQTRNDTIPNPWPGS